MKKITVIWTAVDGYVGGASPQGVKIDVSDFADLDRDDAASLLKDCIQEDFEQKVSWECEDFEEYVDKIMAEAKAESEQVS